jgi:hypothetical protein
MEHHFTALGSHDASNEEERRAGQRRPQDMRWIQYATDAYCLLGIGNGAKCPRECNEYRWLSVRRCWEQRFERQNMI